MSPTFFLCWGTPLLSHFKNNEKQIQLRRATIVNNLEKSREQKSFY